MLVERKLCMLKSRVRNLTIVLFVALVMMAGPAARAFAEPSILPDAIKAVKMGDSAEVVSGRLKGSGTLSTEPIPKENRSKIVWALPENPNYKNVTFQFTEKDRLYLIRFALTEAARMNYHALKKNVFSEFDFSWDAPYKLRLGEDDILLYGPENGMALYYFEFTNRKTHEKTFELFNRPISSEDRVPVPSAAKEESGEKKPDVGGESQTSGDSQKEPTLEGQKKPEGEMKTDPATKPEPDAKP